MADIKTVEHEGFTIQISATKLSDQAYWMGSYRILESDGSGTWHAAVGTVHEQGIESARFSTPELAESHAMECAKLAIDT